jgi:hypothetical protein
VSDYVEGFQDALADIAEKIARHPFNAAVDANKVGTSAPRANETASDFAREEAAEEHDSIKAALFEATDPSVTLKITPASYEVKRLMNRVDDLRAELVTARAQRDAANEAANRLTGPDRVAVQVAVKTLLAALEITPPPDPDVTR